MLSLVSDPSQMSHGVKRQKLVSPDPRAYPEIFRGGF